MYQYFKFLKTVVSVFQKSCIYYVVVTLLDDEIDAIYTLLSLIHLVTIRVAYCA